MKMKIPQHTTAKASYYNTRAKYYDKLNEKNSRNINALLEKICKENHITTVLDMTCGTGSQVFWLKEKGFEVVGSDISRSMLKIAKQKSKLLNQQVKLLEADCRSVYAGQFDAVITIFNSIGHLTREDFILTIQNIKRNLNSGGLYIFDIFNLDYLKVSNNITKLTIDWIIDDGSRKIQFSTISDDGILASYSTYVYYDSCLNTTKISRGYENMLQIYSSTELQEILKNNGFIVLAQTDINGEIFVKETSERILTIAKRI